MPDVTPASRRSLLRTLLKWCVGLLLALLLLAGGLVLFRDTLFRTFVVQTASARTGLKVEIAELHTRLGTGALAIRGAKLFNTPEFGGGVFFDIPELILELDTHAAAEGRLKFKRLLLDLAAVNVVRSKDGRNNFEALEQSLNQTAPKPAPIPRAGATSSSSTNSGLVFGGIDYLKLSINEVQYIDLQHPNRSRRVEIALRDEVVENVRSEEDLQAWAGAFLFRVFLQEAVKKAAERKSGRAVAPHTAPAVP